MCVCEGNKERKRERQTDNTDGQIEKESDSVCVCEGNRNRDR